MNLDAELIGLGNPDQISDEQLIGVLNAASNSNYQRGSAASKVARRTVMRKIGAPSPNYEVGLGNSRQELIKRFGKLPAGIRQAIKNRSAQSVDTHLMVVKSISQVQSVKMLKDSDSKTVGLCDLNGGMLEKGEEMILTGITLLTGTHASSTIESATNVGATDFGPLAKDKMLLPGQFEFIANGQTLIPWCSNYVFNEHYAKTYTDGTNGTAYAYAFPGTSRVGYFHLSNPKLLRSQIRMEFNVEWGANATKNQFLKLILHGSRVYTH